MESPRSWRGALGIGCPAPAVTISAHSVASAIWRDTTRDSAFLAAAVVLSLAWYIGGLGFYSDDWAFIGHYVTAPEQTVSGLYRASVSPQHAMRPLQVWLCAALYRVFGLEPLGYHVVNAALLVANALLVRAVFRAAGAPRPIAMSVALVYALLPSYTTDRFWYVAFAITLSMTACLASAYANVRAAVSRTWSGRVGWKGLSVGAFLASVLAYEVALPLLLIVPLLMLWRLWTDGVPLTRRTLHMLALLIAIDIVLFAGAAVFKVQSTVRLGAQQGIARQVLDIARYAIRTDVPAGEYGLNVANAVRVHFGDYGIELPVNAARAARTAPPPVLLLAAIFGALSWTYLLVTLRREPWPSVRVWSALIPAGLLVFALGYAIFLTNYNVQFTTAGIANRSAIAAALGAAICIVGAIGCAVTVLVPRRPVVAFAALVTGIATCVFVVINVVAAKWIEAYQQEQVVLTGIRERLPTLPAGTTVILDGVCPYIGPAVVFEAPWDLAGALQTIYRDPTLAADVVTPRLDVGEDGITTSIYGDSRRYPYGAALLVYNHRPGTTTPLTDAAAARAYFGISGDGRECPAGREGVGVPMF